MAFPVSTVLDNFNRANGALGSNWTGISGPPEIISGEVGLPSGITKGSAFWHESFGINQAVFFTVMTVAKEYELYLRNTSVGLCIMEIFESKIVLAQYKDSGGVYTELHTSSGAYEAGAAFGFTANSNKLSAWYKTALGETFEEVASATTTLTPEAGEIGFLLEGSTARLDNFGGGTIGTLSFKPSFSSVNSFKISLNKASKISPLFEDKNTIKISLAKLFKIIPQISSKNELHLNISLQKGSIKPLFSSVNSLIAMLHLSKTISTKYLNAIAFETKIGKGNSLYPLFTSETQLSVNLNLGKKLSIEPHFILNSNLFLYISEPRHEGSNKFLRVGPLVVVSPFLSNTHTASVDWRWWLVNTSDMTQIAELNTAHDKNLQIMLNQAGSANFWLHLLDPLTELVHEHYTSIVCYRNGKAIWSGPIYTAKEVSNAQTDRLQITAMGWYQDFNNRILHTGTEFEEMVAKAIAEGRITGYTSLGIEQAIELAYSEYPLGSGNNPGVPLGLIGADLIERANIDVPSNVTMGEIPNTTNSINLTLNQFQNIGEQFAKLSNIESGFDFNIHPLTRKLNIVRNLIRENIAGLGVDRGKGIKFTYPGNCVGAERSAEGLKTRNRFEVIGQYGVEKEQSLASIQKNGLFEEDISLPDVVSPQILRAYAAIQVRTLEQPFTIVSFEPKAVNREDTIISSVPRPFEDYELGDFVYCVIDRGPRFKVGTWDSPKPVRIYGMNINIEDNGTEKINSIQTTYSS